MAQTQNFGIFVPTTNIWDVTNLSNVDPALKELLVRMYQNINNISIALNLKDSGVYNTQPFVTGKTLFPNPALTSASSTVPAMRPIMRAFIPYLQPLPNATFVNIPHNLVINSSWSFIDIYGVGNDPVGKNYIPLPYASPTPANNIEVAVNATDIVVTTGSNRSNFTVNYFVLEYVTS
jgi:hypothetical protein